jgi:hypothetical protein
MIAGGARSHDSNQFHRIHPSEAGFSPREMHHSDPSVDRRGAIHLPRNDILDLPHMQNRKPEAIKHYLEFRLRQFKMLIDAVEDYVEEKYPANRRTFLAPAIS